MLEIIEAITLFLIKWWKVIGILSLVVLLFAMLDKWLYIWDHVTGRSKHND